MVLRLQSLIRARLSVRNWLISFSRAAESMERGTFSPGERAYEILPGQLQKDLRHC